MINIILFCGPHDPDPHVIHESDEWMLYFLVYRLSRTVLLIKQPHPYPHYKPISAGVGLLVSLVTVIYTNEIFTC